MKSSNPHTTHNFVVLYVYVLMHALPGIVDGARKKSQGGRWIWVGASLPMLEATTSRDQCMSDVTYSIAHHGVRASSTIGTAQRI